jgi:hypothetical protein
MIRMSTRESSTLPTACLLGRRRRFLLGLGASGPQVVEGWYGVPFGKPLDTSRLVISVS